MTPLGGRTREDRVQAILRTRLSGIDRITIDDPGTPPYKRYAQIMQNSLATNLFTTDEADVKDECYVYEGSEWELVGVIDLDTGDVVIGKSA